MYNARINVTASVAFARRLLCRLPAGAARTSYCRTLSQAKNLIEDAKAGSLSLSYKDYVLEPAGVHRDDFKKRFHACRSVDEVLHHLVFAGEDSKPVKPQDLVASAEALVRIQYRILSSFQWAYRDSNITMRVQAAANSDTVDMFLSLHHHPSFSVLLDEIDKNMECFSSEEAVHLLDALLKLCVPKNHDVLVKLQERCIAESEALDLDGLVRLAEASNFLKRNGFVLSGLVCSLVQRTFDTIPFTSDSYRSISAILCHVAYFLSCEYVNFVLEKLTAMLSSYRDHVSPSDSLLVLEAAVRFSGDAQKLKPFLDHCLLNCAKLSMSQLSKLLRLCRLGRLEAPSLFEKAREVAMHRKSEGLLRTTDVVGLISIFDDVGWSEGLREEFTGLLAIHMPDVDVLLIKHLASTKFLKECRSKELMNLFAKRWTEKLTDILNTRCLVQELKHGQFALNPDKATVCCGFLFRFGNTRSKECALETMERIKTQLSPLQFFFFFYDQSFLDEFSYEHNLPRIWCKSVLERHQEIPNLHIASYLMMKFFPTGDSRQQQWCISKADARLWADILEASTPVFNHSTFRQVLKCILGHQLYVPATLEVLCESALKKSLKVHLALKLIEACAKVNYRPQCFEELGNLYANHLVEIAEMDKLHVIDILRFSHSLLHLDCFAERLVRKIFSVSYLKKLDSIINECPEMKDDVDRMLFECNRCVELQFPELDVPWMWSAPPSAIESSSPWRVIANVDIEGTQLVVVQTVAEVAGYPWVKRARMLMFHTWDTWHHAVLDRGSRLAIMLLGDEDYCRNENHLLGPIATKLRQLEILGYTVIKHTEVSAFSRNSFQVPCSEFSSIGMDFEAQREYLQEKIFSR
ncbi:hypothetical protein HPB49_007844 [Dermacentor silvarum]|uniref:Uncharacterized protein n=1 Tax=Dermacentor silvarum TaxID=543639 RepID=A0ACB8C880_DERSI|nr:hypothetical protein HPB49_007844 [Dermacentor silvarum]